jgi:hypothetical protein
MELNGLALVFKLTEEEDNKCSISVEFFRDGGKSLIRMSLFTTSTTSI